MCIEQRLKSACIHPPSMAMDLVYPSLDSLAVLEGTLDQRTLIRLRGRAQVDLSLLWSNKSYRRFCRALAHISTSQ